MTLLSSDDNGSAAADTGGVDDDVEARLAVFIVLWCQHRLIRLLVDAGSRNSGAAFWLAPLLLPPLIVSPLPSGSG